MCRLCSIILEGECMHVCMFIDYAQRRKSMIHDHKKKISYYITSKGSDNVNCAHMLYHGLYLGYGKINYYTQMWGSDSKRSAPELSDN